jgi:hypothetical protein
MTDVLAKRFEALAGSAEGDWHDVRRRARRARARLAVPAAAVAAAIAAAAALAATGGWVFSTSDRHVTATTHVVLRGQTWNVSVTTAGRRVCFEVSAPDHPSPRASCVGLGANRRAEPFGALALAVPGGQIWVGVTVGFARRIAITDAAGHAYSAPAVAAPKGTKTPFRYWAVAVAGTRARSITAYGANGRKLTRPVR